MRSDRQRNLVSSKTTYMQSNKENIDKQSKQEKQTLDEGYPLYPVSEDIYAQGIKEENINPEDVTANKQPNVDADANNEGSFDEDVSGGDLDIPGAELDDDLENIGAEDEENNYYSLGGDNHLDLEEPNDA